MTADELILAVLSREPSPVCPRWIEVRAWADHFTPGTVHSAPDSFDLRDALLSLVRSGRVEQLPYFQFRLAASRPADSR